MRATNSVITIFAVTLLGSTTTLQPTFAQSRSSRTEGNQNVKRMVGGGTGDLQPPVVESGFAARLWKSFDYESGLSYEESRQLQRLSNASWPEKNNVVLMGLSEEDYAAKLRLHARWLAHAVIALDPSGELSDSLFRDTLLPAVESQETPPAAVAAAFELLAHLRVESTEFGNHLLEWLNRDGHNPSDLGETLLSSATMLRGDHAAKMAALLTNQIVADSEQNDYALVSSLEALAESLPDEALEPLAKHLLTSGEKGVDTEAFVAVASKLKPKDLIPITEMILETMRDEQDQRALASHASVLGELSKNLDAGASRRIANPLLNHLSTQKGVYPVNMLALTLAGLSTKLDPKEVQKVVDTVVRRLETETDESTRGVLIAALGKLASNIEPARLQSVTDVISDEMRTRRGLFLEDSTTAMAELAPRLSPSARLRYADLIIERIVQTRNPYGTFHFERTLVELIKDVDVEDMRPRGNLLARHVLEGQVAPNQIVGLCETLGAFSNALETEQLSAVTSLLLHKIEAEEESFQRDQLVDAFVPLAMRLSMQQRRALVTNLGDRMRSEEDSEMLADLGRIVAAIASDLADSEVEPAIIAIARRIELEQTASKLEGLFAAAMLLVERWEPVAARSFAVDLVTRVGEERDGYELILLVKLIEKLSPHMRPEDLDRARVEILKRLGDIKDGETLVQLAEVTGALPSQSDSARQAIAERFLRSMAQAIYPDSQWWAYDEEGRLPDLQSIFSEAELQSLVDALKAPLFTDDYVVSAAFRALEHKIGNDFDGDLWKFVDWATTAPEGVSKGLDLKGSGPWARLQESTAIEFPPLQGFHFAPLGNLEFKGAVFGFAVAGDIAYLPAGTFGLRLVDVSDPTKLREVGHAKAGPHAMAVCVAGDYAYVTTGPAGWPEAHLRVVDISNVNAPRVVGSIELPDYPSGVAVRDNLVYVADHSEGLRFIDVSDPSKPREAGNFESPGFIVDVSLTGNYALLADREVGLRAVDISTPAAPKEVGLLKTKGRCIDICIEGERAYAATGDGGLVVVDVSNPRSLQQLARIPTEVALSVACHDNLVVVGAGKYGSRVFDLTDLSRPTAIDLRMSANGAGAFIRAHTLFIADIGLGNMPYGMGNQTILRAYRVTGPDDTAP